MQKGNEAKIVVLLGFLKLLAVMRGNEESLGSRNQIIKSKRKIEDEDEDEDEKEKSSQK